MPKQVTTNITDIPNKDNSKECIIFSDRDDKNTKYGTDNKIVLTRSDHEKIPPNRITRMKRPGYT